MSINDNETVVKNQEQRTAQSRQDSSKPFAAKNLNSAMANINSRMHMGNSRGLQQNVAKTVFDALKELAEQGQWTNDIDMIFLDNTVSRVALSAAVFFLKVGDTVITSTILIEGSESTRIKPIAVDYRGLEKIEMARPATDLYDTTTTAAIEEEIRRNFPGESLKVLDVGANMFFSELSFGVSTAELVKSPETGLVLFYAINNLLAKYVEMTNDTDKQFNTAWAVSDGTTRIRANIDKNPAPVFTASGLPVRADVAITISATTSDNSNGAKFDTANELTLVTGYMDLTYVDQRDAAALQSQATGVQIDPNTITQTYLPRLVITRAESLQGLITSEFSLLALASTVALSRDNAWIGLFAPKYGKRVGNDLSDVGAIGFEATHLTEDNTPARIDVKSDGFASNPANLVDLITTAMFPNIAYSMDILECSDLGFFDTLYLAAASGNPSAINALIQHADQLTDGRFSTMWKGGEVASYNNVLIPIGYYEDKDGNRKDLRDWDYLAMLNTYGDKDASIVQKFADTLDKTDVPSDYRVAVAKDILVNTIGASVNVKGFAHRIDWNPAFLNTLVAAISATGFVVESNSIGAYSANTNRRGNAAALNNALKYQSAQGFLTYQNNSGYTGGNYTAQFHNSWNR